MGAKIARGAEYANGVIVGLSLPHWRITDADLARVEGMTTLDCAST